MNTSKYINLAFGPLQVLTRDMGSNVREVVHLICELIRMVMRKSIPVKTKADVISRASDILSQLGDAYPERHHTIMLHLTLHVIEQQYVWGQVDMRIFERMQHIIKGNTKSYTNPEASFANNYTYFIGGEVQMKILEDVEHAMTPKKVLQQRGKVVECIVN